MPNSSVHGCKSMLMKEVGILGPVYVREWVGQRAGGRDYPHPDFLKQVFCLLTSAASAQKAQQLRPM
jgi:hypothetical protein